MARLSDKFAQHAQRLGGGAASPLGLAGKRDVLTELPVEQVHPDPDQPRRDLGDLTELSASIRELGVVQPIIVSVDGYDSYRIIAGERRYTAAKAAGLPRIPAIVRTVEDHERLALQLIENLHRKDLSPFEEAASYRRLLDEFGLTQEELAKRLGKSQEAVNEGLRLLSLPETVQEGYAEAQRESGGRISRSLLVELARRPAGEQAALWEEARRGELSVRKLREVRAAERGKNGAAAGAASAGATSAAPTVPVTGHLRKKPGFRYPITLTGHEATVTVEFASFQATGADVIAALEEALEVERARIDR